MRVGVQCWLPMGSPSGARTRLLGLLRGLSGLPEASDLECHLLTGPEPHPALVRIQESHPCFRLRRTPIPPGPTLCRSLQEGRKLASFLAGLDLLDLQSLPLPRVPIPMTLTLHDLRDLGPFARGFRAWCYARVLGKALQACRRILVPSPPVARRLLALHPELEGLIDLVPAGISLPGRGEPPLPRPYFLHLGRDEARKNLPFLLEAYALALRWAPALPELVLGGPGAFRKLRRRARRLSLGSGVRFVGELGEEEKWGWLLHAEALLFPSLEEGFGLPVLEALAASCPCFVNQGGAPAWVLGGAGEVLPAGDLEAWARALSDPERRRSRETGERARRRAQEFPLARAARSWLESWRRALGIEAEVMEPRSELRALFSGYVQGVGFRWRTRECLAGSGLSGWVRNLPDGRVELRIQGGKKELDEALARVRELFEDCIRSVEVEEREAGEDLGPFRIEI